MQNPIIEVEFMSGLIIFSFQRVWRFFMRIFGETDYFSLVFCYDEERGQHKNEILSSVVGRRQFFYIRTLLLLI